MSIQTRISPCLWFDDQAESAAHYYVSIFKNSRILTVSHYGEAGFEVHGRPAGSVLTVAFELDGQHFLALNGGPLFKFSEAISLIVSCDTQADIDYYWERLCEDGDPAARQCGWLKDKFGLSWQVVPAELDDLICDPDPGVRDRVMTALLKMSKLDLDLLRAARAG